MSIKGVGGGGLVGKGGEEFSLGEGWCICFCSVCRGSLFRKDDFGFFLGGSFVGF